MVLKFTTSLRYDFKHLKSNGVVPLLRVSGFSFSNFPSGSSFWRPLRSAPRFILRRVTSTSTVVLVVADRSMGCSCSGPAPQNGRTGLHPESTELGSFLGVSVEVGEVCSDDGGDGMTSGSSGKGARIGKKGNK